MPPKLSVIVPFHNAEQHFEECLDSLREQVFRDIGVILVDRGSMAGGRAIAQAAAVRDARFTVIAQEGRGLGAARNTGVRHATGTYLAFADSSDVLAGDAYQRLVGTLESTGSDMACGGVLALTATGMRGSAPHTRAFATTALRTHITATPELVQDLTAGNKVFRRSFWDEHGFAFPDTPDHSRAGGSGSSDGVDGWYGDPPVVISAHVLARSVDVLSDIVYLRRATPGSAVGLRTRPAELERRFASLLQVSDFLAVNATKLRKRHDRNVAEHDLGRLLDALTTAEGQDLETLLRVARQVLDRLHRRATERLPVIQRLQLHLARNHMADELGQVQRFARSELRDRGVVRKGLREPRWYADYPFLGDDRVPMDVFAAERELTLRARVDDVRYAAGTLRITGHAYIKHLASRAGAVELWLQHGDEQIKLAFRRTARPDVTADSDQSAVSYDKSGFATKVDVTRLPEGDWTLHARVSTRGITREGVAIAHHATSERTFQVGRVRVSLTRDEGLVLDSGGAAGPRPTGDRVTGIRWTEDHELVLAGVGGSRTRRIVLQREGGTERHQWPVHWHDSRFMATLGMTADDMPEGIANSTGANGTGADGTGADGVVGSGLPLRSGRWAVLIGDDALTLGPDVVAHLPEPHTTGVQEISVHTDLSNELALVIKPALGAHERGRYAARRLRGGTRHARLLNAAVFDSYGGGQYSCNPRAISEELQRRHPGVEPIWVTRDGQFRVPEGVRTVLYGSRAHEEALGTARFVVANRRTQPGWYVKRPGQMFVQTWHGTPLKRLGLDLKGTPYAQLDFFDDLDRYAAMWDLLISPNPFSTPILRRAFGYQGEVIESGYPRNDALFRPELREQVRRRLGVSAGKRVILYAPTWRDDEHARGDALGLRLDVERTVKALGVDDILLVRAHYLVADRMTIPPQAVDVSRFPDMAELLAAADVLVTDYSSAMFDFACTGRPMVFYTYDLDQYRDEVRGFYFDFEREAPGPIARTEEDLVDILHDRDGLFEHRDSHGHVVSLGGRDERAARYADFKAKFCPWDDGQASARVVERMLG